MTPCYSCRQFKAFFHVLSRPVWHVTARRMVQYYSSAMNFLSSPWLPGVSANCIFLEGHDWLGMNVWVTYPRKHRSRCTLGEAPRTVRREVQIVQTGCTFRREGETHTLQKACSDWMPHRGHWTWLLILVVNQTIGRAQWRCSVHYGLHLQFRLRCSSALMF